MFKMSMVVRDRKYKNFILFNTEQKKTKILYKT